MWKPVETCGGTFRENIPVKIPYILISLNETFIHLIVQTFLFTKLVSVLFVCFSPGGGQLMSKKFISGDFSHK